MDISYKGTEKFKKKQNYILFCQSIITSSECLATLVLKVKICVFLLYIAQNFTLYYCAIEMLNYFSFSSSNIIKFSA